MRRYEPHSRSSVDASLMTPLSMSYSRLKMKPLTVALRIHCSDRHRRRSQSSQRVPPFTGRLIPAVSAQVKILEIGFDRDPQNALRWPSQPEKLNLDTNATLKKILKKSGAGGQWRSVSRLVLSPEEKLAPTQHNASAPSCLMQRNGSASTST